MRFRRVKRIPVTFFLRPKGTVELLERKERDEENRWIPGTEHMVWEGDIQYEVWATGKDRKGVRFETRVKGYTDMWSYGWNCYQSAGLGKGVKVGVILEKDILQILKFFRELSGTVALPGAETGVEATEQFEKIISDELVGIAKILGLSDTKITIVFPDVFNWTQEVDDR